MPNLDPFRSPQARARFIEKYDAVVADWPVDCEERDLETEFGTTHVIVSGPESAPPLVLLHGAGATALMWRPVIEALSATYRCYCVDTIIEGNKSIATRRSLGKTKLVAWLRQVFAALDIEQARVVGLSYGGWLAANLAVQSPELVNRLVLLCPAATFAPITLEFYRGVFSTSLLRSPERARRFAQWLSSTPNVESDPTVDLIVTAAALRQSSADWVDATDGAFGRHAAANKRADNGRDRGSRSHLPRRPARGACQGAEADPRRSDASHCRRQSHADN